MSNGKRVLIGGLALSLAGCAPLESGLGRVLLLVVVPAAIVGALLWFMRGRDDGPKGPVHPDDDREE